MKTEGQKKYEKVPVFKSWRTWYLVVLGNLALLILFFTLLTRLFR